MTAKRRTFTRYRHARAWWMPWFRRALPITTMRRLDDWNACGGMLDWRPPSRPLPAPKPGPWR